MMDRKLKKGLKSQAFFAFAVPYFCASALTLQAACFLFVLGSFTLARLNIKNYNS